MASDYLKNNFLKFGIYTAAAISLFLTTSCGNKCGELGCNINGKSSESQWKNGKGIELSDSVKHEHVKILGSKHIRVKTSTPNIYNSQFIMEFLRENGDIIRTYDPNIFTQFNDERDSARVNNKQKNRFSHTDL
jgi:hypothetical protein